LCPNPRPPPPPPPPRHNLAMLGLPAGKIVRVHSAPKVEK
jgi:hypothetical protein